MRRTNRWASEQGVCLELQHLDEHLIAGMFFYKTIALNSVSFTGLVDRTLEKTVFVSMFNIILPSKSFYVVLQGMFQIRLIQTEELISYFITGNLPVWIHFPLRGWN